MIEQKAMLDVLKTKLHQQIAERLDYHISLEITVRDDKMDSLLSRSSPEGDDRCTGCGHCEEERPPARHSAQREGMEAIPHH